jgi:transposase
MINTIQSFVVCLLKNFMPDVPQCREYRTGRKRKEPARYNNKRLHRKRCRIENAFCRLKNWRGIAIRYERRADIFLNAIILAAIVIVWI